MRCEEHFTYSQKGPNEQNEDLATTYTKNGISLNFICDGMSNYGHGSTGALTVSQGILETIESLSDKDIHVYEMIKIAVAISDRKVWEKRVALKTKFGSTLGGVISKGNLMYAFWIGDVKIFQVRDNVIIFESNEHSLRKATSLPAYQTSESENIVTALISGRGIEKLATVPLEIQNEDIIIISSDGLWKSDIIPQILGLENNSLLSLLGDISREDDHTLIKFRIVI